MSKRSGVRRSDRADAQDRVQDALWTDTEGGLPESCTQAPQRAKVMLPGIADVCSPAREGTLNDVHA